MKATRICSIEDCDRPAVGRSYCGMHYQRWRKRGSPYVLLMDPRRTPEQRFWSKIDQTEGCWLWTGTIDADGYARFYLQGRMVAAYRYAYEILIGPIPPGLTIDHLCRIRSCVNPKHLEPVTNGENVLRGNTLPAANVCKTHCPQGHPYDEANTSIGTRGERLCRTCRRVAARKYYAKIRR